MNCTQHKLNFACNLYLQSSNNAESQFSLSHLYLRILSHHIKSTLSIQRIMDSYPPPYSSNELSPVQIGSPQSFQTSTNTNVSETASILSRALQQPNNTTINLTNSSDVVIGWVRFRFSGIHNWLWHFLCSLIDQWRNTMVKWQSINTWMPISINKRGHQSQTIIT